MDEPEVNGTQDQPQDDTSAMCSFHVEILDASKDGEVVKYTIQTMTGEKNQSDGGVVVLRQYEDFEFLYHCLIAHNDIEAVVVPPLPPKPTVTPSGAEAKSRRQLGNQAKTMIGDEFSKDCKTLQSFLELVIAHPQLNKDETLKKFLTADEPPIRASVKKGVFNSLMKQIEDVRFHHHKDISDEFQQKREYTDELATSTKNCSQFYQKMTNSSQRVAQSLASLSSSFLVNASIDNQENELSKTFVEFANSLENSQKHFDASSFTEDDTIGFYLELYARYLEAAKQMLLRRTVKLVEYENASKALDKAKPKNIEQLESVKLTAQQAYDDITEKAEKEIHDFDVKRIHAFQAALIALAEGQIDNGKKAIGDIQKSLTELRAFQL